MHLDPITRLGQTHAPEIIPPVATTPDDGEQPLPESGGFNWAAILAAACYFILALAAFSGVHQAVVVGCCYLLLAALVGQLHKQA